ncbi:MAG: class I SAM-dependent methyltransferase [Polyangiaceae bacterium]|nr:class I SAM-dependent methyltransferase [Polyangiaceae bacterium]
MNEDLSNGWEAVAERFIECRSDIGAATVRQWATCLPKGGSVLDVGCGSGVPISMALMDDGFQVAGLDASPTLVGAFRTRFPGAVVACEAAEQSRFFGRTFDGVIAIGLLFLLSEQSQRELVRRLASALRPGGRLLFTAPHERCVWTDQLTGRTSLSLGAAEYRRLLEGAGMALARSLEDEGENHYYDALAVGGTQMTCRHLLHDQR